MADYPSTGTLFDGSPPPATGGRTRAGLSTQIIVYVNNEPVGAIQTITESQARTLKPISEIGTDGQIEIVPNQSATFNLQINRIVFDGISLPEAFSRGFRNIQSQRMPFDIVIIDKFSGSGNDAVVTTYHNCWFSALGKTYSAADYTIAETATVSAEHMSTTRGGEPVSLSQGVQGSREIPGRSYDSVEGAADSGERRGALDFPGLISAAY
jgi:hypothetical protein